ncbi:MAG TPA: ATP-dependent DNA helicase RecG [Candidatus Saccharimonadales bacterium]|nr:ATP-dependent DNA helicase RecG [Candidatus Saccharimonadales bacterium]
MLLSSRVAEVKGVGPALAERFEALHIRTVKDLIYFFPRKYDDFSQVTKIDDLVPGKVTIKGTVESVVGRYIKRRLHITEAIIADETSKVRAVWFNQPYRATQLAKGDEYYFSGAYDFQRNRYVLSNPATEKADSFGVSTARIVPIYRESKGLKSQQLRKVMKELLPLMDALPETLPPVLVKKFRLASVNETLKNLHFPQNTEELERAKRRTAFEELIWLITASLINKNDQAGLTGWRIDFKKPIADAFVKTLPFKMTGAQKKAAWEIFQDMESGSPMNRLVQGDVGSGKTVVGAMAAYLAAEQGYQTAFMAPTEILATQHATSIANLLEPLGVRVGLLVGSTKTAQKSQLKKKASKGDLDIIVGTHALIQGDTEFNKLGLVIIDEQHRFGVRQRSELLTKSKHMPHLLSMTATPIPRSLQLTVYGDLEVSIIDEMPKGRQPIETEVVKPAARHTVYEKIEAQIRQGRQAYVVCPLITDGINAELKSVQTEYERLNKSIFKHRQVGLLHGQMKADEKEHVMRQFKSGKLDILISTTVIEVGVDVPNATVMLIEGADRFGLAQLHQLRGRVGRGSEQSYCYLIPSGDNVSQRLRELEKSNDGFYLAEVDLKLRGPGEVYGRAQSGKLDMSFVNLADTRLIKQVRLAAAWLIQSKLSLVKYKELADKVNHYRRLTSLN